MHNSIDIRMVGETIKQLRLSRNWTQDRLADAAGYSVRNLRRIENGGTVSLDVVNTFAEIFQVSAVDILKGCLLFLSAGSGKQKKMLPAFAIRYLLQSVIHTHARRAERRGATPGLPERALPPNHGRNLNHPPTFRELQRE